MVLNALPACALPCPALGCLGGRAIPQTASRSTQPHGSVRTAMRMPRSGVKGGTTAVPTAAALAVDVKAGIANHHRVFEFDEPPLRVLQRGLDRYHHSHFERAAGVIGVIRHWP